MARTSLTAQRIRTPPLSLLMAIACLAAGTVGTVGFQGSRAHAEIEPPILRISMEAEPITFDWNNTRSATDRFILSFIARGLLKYDDTAKLICDLCTSFQTSDSGKALQFDLDPQAVWSDGTPVEAQQFVDSFRRLLNPANAFPAASDFRIIEGAVQSGKKWNPENLAVRAETKNRLQIKLSRPSSLFAHFLTTIAASPIRKEFLRPRDTGEEHATMAALGPYQLAGWERGKRIVLEGNPKFKGSRPVYRVELIHGSHAEQIKRFEAGKLDIVSGPTTEDILRLAGRKVQVNPYWATRSIVFNIKRGAAADQHFRRAILYSLNRNALPAFLKTGERRATGMIPPGLTGNRDLPLATLDLARAASEAALAPRTPSKPSAKPAPSLRLELLVPNFEQDRQVATWISEQLKKIGVAVEVKAKPSVNFFRDLESGMFEAAIVTWPFRIASALELLASFQSQSSKNHGHWAHVPYDSVIERLLNDQTLTPASAAGLIDQACRILEVEGVAAIPLGYPTQPFLLGRRVEAFATTPFGDPDLVKIRLKQ